MNLQNDKEGSGHVKAAIIGGVFALLAACVGGVFLLLNTMVNNGVIVFGASNPSNPNSPATATASQYQAPSSNQPTSVAPKIQPTNTAALSRCELIAQNFPQSSNAIASEFGIPVNSIFDVIHENCGSNIIDGFVYRSNQEVEWTVPDGGCIDAPPDAYFSDATSSNGVGGSRVFSGIVRASQITYRMWCYK
jgi:hypothetical protein